MSGWLIAAIVAALLIFWLKRKAATSPNLVVTGPGVLKTHDVECKFRSEAGYHGDLDQSRWSDGQERFQLNLRKLPDAYSGPLRLLLKGEHVADFEARSGRVDFAWKGMADGDNPKFEIGDEITLEFGGQTLTGIVEPD